MDYSRKILSDPTIKQIDQQSDQCLYDTRQEVLPGKQRVAMSKSICHDKGNHKTRLDQTVENVLSMVINDLVLNNPYRRVTLVQIRAVVDYHLHLLNEEIADQTQKLVSPSLTTISRRIRQLKSNVQVQKKLNQKGEKICSTN